MITEQDVRGLVRFPSSFPFSKEIRIAGGKGGLSPEAAFLFHVQHREVPAIVPKHEIASSGEKWREQRQRVGRAKRLRRLLDLLCRSWDDDTMRNSERVHRFQLTDDAAELQGVADYLLKRRSYDPGRDASNRGGWQSSPDVHEAAEISPLSARLLENVRPFIGNAEIGQSWANINERGDWNKPHHHKGWHHVALLMVQPVPLVMPPGQRDDGALLMLDHLDRMNAVEPRLKAGEVLVFGSGVLHMVGPHQQSQPRITLAYNLRISDGH